MYENNLKCYNFKKIIYDNGLLDNGVDATYIIHLVGNGRYTDIIKQLTLYKPTKTIYILFNKGYKKCKKEKYINLPCYDLVDAFLEIFKHASNKNYNNILILEDDFIFSNKINQKQIQNNICSFVNKHKYENFQYLLGCIPFIKIPYTFNFIHYISIFSIGTHAAIYSKLNRDKILKIDKKKINDWDMYNCLYSRRYMYKIPVCYQLFPDTDNSNNWSKNNIILYFFGQITKKILNFSNLDIRVEPGYSYFYTFSTFFTIILLFILILICLLFIKYLRRWL